MDTILFLHGWGGNEQSFAPIMPVLKKHFRCITLGMPMFNNNDTDEPGTPWTLEDYANHVENYLDSLGVTKCHIVAHSFGARVTCLLVTRNPKRYEKLILTGAAGIRPRQKIRTMLKIWSYKVKRKFAKIFFRNTSSNDLTKKKKQKEYGSVEYRQLSLQGKITFQNIIKRDLKPEIKQITNQTLLIFGKSDTATPVKMGKKWARLSQNAALKIYENSGHFCFLDEPNKFLTDTLKFLAQ